MAQAFVLNRPYPTAPFSTLYLFGRGQDVGFQRAIGDSPRKRHHVRFWGLPIDRAEETLDTPAFWLNSDRPGRRARALDRRRDEGHRPLADATVSFQITHATDADTNAERDFIIGELTQAARSCPSALLRRRAGEIGKVNRYVTDGEVAAASLA